MPDVEIEVTLTQTEYEYTGLDISAYFTITIKGTDKEIDKSECAIIYTNNKEVGEATVEIKDNGTGNYAIKNTVTKNFTIKKRTTGEPRDSRALLRRLTAQRTAKLRERPSIWNIPPIRRSLHLTLVRILKQPDLQKERITFAIKQPLPPKQAIMLPFT